MKPILSLALVFGLASLPATAADHVMEMLNQSEQGSMVFEPAFLEIGLGDTILFKATDKLHNAETRSGQIPEGAEPFKGKLNQDLSVTFDVPGVYNIICQPHYGMGMVAVVVVGGDTHNLEALKQVSYPRQTEAKLFSLYEQIDAPAAQ